MKVLVVGGGAAGLMAAGAALRQGHEVTVLEHMEKPAQKILVTGKGRCNVTNDCTAEEFLHHVRTNPRFLFSSLGAFPPARTMELFESLGVELKVERGRRVFPVSDKAEEIRQALLRYADGADIVHDGAKKLLLEPLAQPEEAPAAPEDPRHPKKKKPGPAYRCVGVRGTSGREYKADAVLVATGGLSYPTTGSTGDGYKLAQQAGHTLVEPVPSLVSLVSHDADCKKMMGLALKNVTLTLHEDGKPIFEEQGEMLFTHFGISGPLTLSASSHLGDMKKHKGRCNVTNDCTAEEFLHHVRTNPRFLFSSLGAFPPARTMELFESLGVELKVERGRRVFPVSDKAEEIRQALLRYADGADIVHDGAKKLLLEPLAQPEEAPAAPEDPRHPKKKKPGPAYRCVGVRGTSGREYKADAVLVATGGLSYPTTGSTGDGYKLAQQAGHTLVEPVPSLVSLVSHDADCKKMMGLALKNVTLTLHEDGKPIFEEQGEMLFTHFGISGPLTLSASSHLGDMKKHKYEAFIDLKPALSEEQLYDRITRDFALLANHAAQGALVKLLPSSMQPVMVARWGIDPATRANQITREQKRELVQLMKHWRVSIDARGDLAHAVITSGGVSVREVDPKTMQSKKALGLYFAGEVLDVDAYTGGYNLQIAFCTAQSFANHLE